MLKCKYYPINDEKLWNEMFPGNYQTEKTNDRFITQCRVHKIYKARNKTPPAIMGKRRPKMKGEIQSI